MDGNDIQENDMGVNTSNMNESTDAGIGKDINIGMNAGISTGFEALEKHNNYEQNNQMNNPMYNRYGGPMNNQRNGAPMNGMPMNGAPMNGMPMNGGPMNGMPMNGAPMNGMPMNGAPMNGMPMNGMPMNGAPMNGMPMNGAPMNGMPMNGAPMNGMPMNGAPMNGMPMNGMPMNNGYYQMNGGFVPGPIINNMMSPEKAANAKDNINKAIGSPIAIIIAIFALLSLGMMMFSVSRITYAEDRLLSYIIGIFFTVAPNLLLVAGMISGVVSSKTATNKKSNSGVGLVKAFAIMKGVVTILGATFIFGILGLLFFAMLITGNFGRYSERNLIYNEFIEVGFIWMFFIFAFVGILIIMLIIAYFKIASTCSACQSIYRGRIPKRVSSMQEIFLYIIASFVILIAILIMVRTNSRYIHRDNDIIASVAYIIYGIEMIIGAIYHGIVRRAINESIE